nr:EOG090X01W2 [Lepidurus arcticus]
MASPSPSLDSLGTSPLGSLIDHNEQPSLLGIDTLVGMAGGPLGSLMGAFSSGPPALNPFSLSSALMEATTASLNKRSFSHSLSSSSHSVSAGLGSVSMTTAVGPGSSSSSSSSSSSGVSSPGLSLNTKCALCLETFTLPKVLPCLHTFCQSCLEKQQAGPDKLTCPVCRMDCTLTAQGVAGLLSDYAMSSLLENSSCATTNTTTIVATSPPLSSNLSCSASSTTSSTSSSSTAGLPPPSGEIVFCTGCKSRESSAVACCYECSNYLCPHCVMAHQFMHCFEGHRVMTLSESRSAAANGSSHPGQPAGTDKAVSCSRHVSQVLSHYCRHCVIPVCNDCVMEDHATHELEPLQEAAPRISAAMGRTVSEARQKAADLKSVVQAAELAATRLTTQYTKAQGDVTDTYNFYRSLLEERQNELLKEMETNFTNRQSALSELGQKTQETVERILRACNFVERLLKYTSPTETLLFKKLLDNKFSSLLAYSPDSNVQNSAGDIEFVSNYQAIQVGVRNTFGYIRSGADLQGPQKQPPIARPTPSAAATSASHTHACNSTSLNNLLNQNHLLGGNGGGGLLSQSTHLINSHLERSFSNGFGLDSANNANNASSAGNGSSSLLSKRYSNMPHATAVSSASMGPLGLTPFSDVNLSTVNVYEKWATTGSGVNENQSSSLFMASNRGHDLLPSSLNMNVDPLLADLTSKLISTAMFPPKSHVKRQKMIYHCKFGEFGVMEGQFTEPSGVAVNAQNDIIVADTNNHRIQIFDKEGRFKFQFGECGKRDGQLLYPNRVAVVRNSGDIIVTERSPTHQIQIYNQYGQFVRKFGANVLQHPRGITVDNKGRIIVVECKVMRVLIFDQMGNVLQKFGCSKHLEFPNGVVVNDKQEIFISDNRAHCVKVFNYEGVYLRQIGGEGITNYPIGVGINAAGEILIADNHNNFNLTIFTQDGNLVSALESKVKHAQCFDVALMDDGSVVLASKDYRLYVYRYLQVPSAMIM